MTKFANLPLLLLVFALLPGIAAQADTITVVADEWCPYNCEEGSTEPGFMIEIARDIFKRHGHTLTYQVMPWARAIEETRAGKFNAIAGAVQGDAPDFVYPKVAMAQSVDATYVKAGNAWRYNGTSSLDKVSIGVIRDYSYGSPLDEYIEANHNNPARVQVSSGNDALNRMLKKLLAGRLDTLVEDALVMDYYLSKGKLVQQVTQSGTVSKPEDAHIAFSPANPKSTEYAKMLSDGIAEMRANGELDKVLKRYGIDG